MTTVTDARTAATPAANGEVAPARAWRTDLEGLRVIAIVLVAVYHVWFHRVSGGVDVFLMLSGFFVGGSLVRRFASGRPPHAGEYVARHARRLVPAAATVLLVTGVATAVLLPQTRWISAAWESLASLTYWENWRLLFAGQVYGAADSGTSLWQHFWSLSVQGQLFLAIPAVLAVTLLSVRGRSDVTRRRTIMTVILVGFLGSFVYAMFATSWDQPAAYFDTFARAWEFLAGTLLAVLLAWWKPAWPRVWSVAGWLGIAGLIATGAVVDGGATFPGPWTLLPVGAAALIVVSGAARPDGYLARGLGWRPLATSGRYAYGFYLWHWPLLVMVIELGGTITLWSGLAILASAAVLAVATYHLVEAPARIGALGSWPRRSASVFTLTAAVAIVATCASWLVHTRVVEQSVDATQANGISLIERPGAMSVFDQETYGTFPDIEPFPPLSVAFNDVSRAEQDGCSADFEESVIRTCTYGNPDGDVRVVLVGGSHASQWSTPLADLATANDWRMETWIKAGCPLVPPEDGASDECNDWRENVFNALEDNPPDLVVTISTRPVWGVGGDFVPDSVRERFRILNRLTDVVGIRDNAWFNEAPIECWETGARCAVPLLSRISPEDPTENMSFSNVAFVDLNEYICPELFCRPVVGNRFVFRDTNHLTETYASSLSAPFSEHVGAALETLGWSDGRPSARR